jgi:hypothetical protein
VNTPEKIEYKKNLIDAWWGVFGTVDGVATSAFYTSFIQPSLTTVYYSTLRFILLPAYAFDAAASIFLAWYLAHIDRNPDGALKKGRIVAAVISLITGAAMIAAVVTSFVAAALAPLFFAINMGVNALFNIGAAIYYWGKSVATPEPATVSEGEKPVVNRKKLYRDRAIGHVIAGIIGTCMTIVAVTVFPLAKVMYAPAGTVLGIIAAAINAFSIYKSVRKIIAIRKEFNAKKPIEAMETAKVQHSMANTNDIMNKLDIKPREQVIAKHRNEPVIHS